MTVGEQNTSMPLKLQKPIVYVGDRPSDFCVVTAVPSLARYAEEVAHDMQIRTCIALAQVDTDVEVALELLRTEHFKLMATRGYAAHILQGRTATPVLTIGYSPEVFLEALLPYQNTNMVVGHLCFPEQGLGFQKIAGLLGLRGYRLEVEDRNDIDKALEEAREKNVTLLLGGLGLISKAREKGVDGIPLLAENKEAVYRTFSEAKYILTINSINEARHTFIRTVLDTNPNIIMYIDSEYTIAYANDTAVRTFDFTGQGLTGTPLANIFPEASVADMFLEENRKGDPGLLTDKLHREFLFELTSLVLQNGKSGFILSLNSVADIQKNERNVRRTQYVKKQPRLFSINDIKGSSAAIMEARARAVRFSGSDMPVLITGETGTGKEMFAQVIHSLSKRNTGPFISINCASLSENLLESELFGYEEGAFTSARRGGKPGLLELADKGTVFLDEIGEISPAVQARLLRVLQDQLVMRLGSTRFLPVDVRVICATNRDIFSMVRDGRFRADLFYRIDTLILHVPSLEARKEDIVPIARQHLKKTQNSLCPEAEQKLLNHVWHGNVRELIHVLDRAAVMHEGALITAEDIRFDEELLHGRPQSRSGKSDPDAGTVLEALRTHQYNKGKTAEALGISRTTLWKKMKRLGLD